MRTDEQTERPQVSEQPPVPRWKLLLQIFGTFFKMGCFTFGSGLSILLQLEEEYVDKRKLLTSENVLELTTVGKSVPGVMITNVSMLVGYQLAGVFGGVLAVVGLTLPAIFILSLVTYFYEAIKTNVWFAAAMRGVNASVVAIIASTVWNMGKDALKDKITVLICGAAFLLCLFTGVSNILMIACGVLLALLWVGAKAVTERRGGRP